VLNLSAIIKIYRKTLGLSLEELAKIIGVPKTILYGFESGKPIAQRHLLTIIQWSLRSE